MFTCQAKKDGRRDFVMDTRSSQTKKKNQRYKYIYRQRIDRPLLPFHYTRREITLFSSFLLCLLLPFGTKLTLMEEHLSNKPAFQLVCEMIFKRGKEGKENEK